MKVTQLWAVPNCICESKTKYHYRYCPMYKSIRRINAIRDVETLNEDIEDARNDVADAIKDSEVANSMD